VKVIFCTEPIRFPLTGVGRYAYELACRLGQIQEIEALKFFSGSGMQELPDRSRPPATEAESSVGGLKRALMRMPLLVDTVSSLLDTCRAHQLRGYGGWLYHSPNYYLPRFKGACVATFHDLSVFTLPECHPPELVRFMQQQLKKTLERARFLLTDSEYTRQELADFFSWPLDRIRAVPLASSGDFRPRTPQQTLPLLSRHSLLHGGYCLYTGTIEPRKNLDVLLNAYGGLPESLRQRCPLVLAGYRGWSSEAVHARIERGAREGWVRYLGYLPDAELPLLFSGARLFAFPSLYEGFGLPVLEAMASGVAVICSRSSSLPEVAGEAAVLFDPSDVDALRELLKRGMEDEDWRSEAAARGLLRAQEFSWERCAQQTAAVYAEAIAS